METNFVDKFLWGFGMLYGVGLIGLAVSLLIYRPRKTATKKFISVVIAARNESANIIHCLESLFSQSYDENFFEVIVVNDRSADATAESASVFGKRFQHFTLIEIDHVPSGIAPKKHALSEGIRIAQGEVILCTDADCRAERGWIENMAACFTDEVGMVVGYSPIAPKRPFSLFHNFVALDSLALASVAAASSLWSGTLTATGRSLAYRKEVFEEVGGFRQIAHFISGDDDLLLGLVKRTRWKIAYCIAKDSLVHSDPPSDFSKFINQKIRQASKGRHYSAKMIAGLMLFYTFNLLLVTYCPYKWLGSGPAKIYLGPWLMKIAADFFVLLAGSWRFRKWSYLKMYALVALVHPLYIAIFGAWGQFGDFEWKNDVHESILK
jgi:cellulose synthase/poly-beta-1,6-N-acetylglucosamine synthase-like glycosyltransferase